jgi:hypothetical protein
MREYFHAVFLLDFPLLVRMAKKRFLKDYHIYITLEKTLTKSGKNLNPI